MRGDFEFIYNLTLTLPSPFRENLQGEPIEGEEKAGVI
jgi:hypothetical protein